MQYSQILLYGHLSNTDTSQLRWPWGLGHSLKSSCSNKVQEIGIINMVSFANLTILATLVQPKGDSDSQLQCINLYRLMSFKQPDLY